MKRIGNILKGWAKALRIIKTSSDEKNLSSERLAACGKCEHASKSKVLAIINGHATYEHQLQCTKCGCPCLEKSLVKEETCPLGKW